MHLTFIRRINNDNDESLSVRLLGYGLAYVYVSLSIIRLMRDLLYPTMFVPLVLPLYMHMLLSPYALGGWEEVQNGQKSYPSTRVNVGPQP